MTSHAEKREQRKAAKIAKQRARTTSAAAALTKNIGDGVGVPRVQIARESTNEDSRTPVFSFEHVDRTGCADFGWDLTDACREKIMDFLHEISGNTWTQIKAQTGPGKAGQHKYHHHQDLSTLCEEARARFEALKLDQFADQVFRFRLGTCERLWGFVHEAVFYAVWWDPKHKVYPLPGMDC